MTAVALDTLRISKRLREAGFSEPQAEAMTGVLHDAQEVALGDLVTRNDLDRGLAATRNDIDRGLAETRNDLDRGLAEVKTELKLEIAGVKADIVLLKWMAGVSSAMSIAILLKLFLG